MTHQLDTLIDTLDSFEPRSRDATASGAQAFARLLALAEQRNSGQIVRVVQFIAATRGGPANLNTAISGNSATTARA